MIKINLIPAEYIEGINRRAIIAKAIMSGILVVAVVAGLTVWHFARAKNLEKTLVVRTAELKALQSDVEKVKAIEAQIAEVQRYLDAINRITRGRFMYTTFMQDLTSELPATIWFSNISTSVKGSSLKVSLAISSRSSYDLAYWINYLETNALYSDAKVSTISLGEDDSGRVFTTSISFVYNYK